MLYQNRIECDKKLYQSLRINCEKCFGFCCVALYFSASEGFPSDKKAGRPCINLKSDFSCSIHKSLREKGLKGCTAYDCFGAGQKTAQVTYGGHDWHQLKESAAQMFDVFLVMRQLHEMLWYLAEADRVLPDHAAEADFSHLINQTEKLTFLDADALLKLDIVSHRDKVNSVLRRTSDQVRAKVHGGRENSLKHKKAIAGMSDFIGADMRKLDLRGADLRGALLIAADLRNTDLTGADLIGADLRDADLRGANLQGSIFVTQSQINSAVGNSYTKLPISLVRPEYWEK